MSLPTGMFLIVNCPDSFVRALTTGAVYQAEQLPQVAPSVSGTGSVFGT